MIAGIGTARAMAKLFDLVRQEKIISKVRIIFHLLKNRSFIHRIGLASMYSGEWLSHGDCSCHGAFDVPSSKSIEVVLLLFLIVVTSIDFRVRCENLKRSN